MALLLGIRLHHDAQDSDYMLWRVGILLRQAPTSPDPTRPLYDIVCDQLGSPSERLCCLPHDPWQLAARSKIRLQWRTIYIRRSGHRTMNSEPLDSGRELQVLRQNLHAPFHIPPSHVKTFLRVPGASVVFRGADLRNATASSLSKYATLNFDISKSQPADSGLPETYMTNFSITHQQSWKTLWAL